MYINPVQQSINYRLIRCFFILITFSTICAKSQTKIKYLTNTDNLANNAINVINKDNHGNLWIGTWDGLSEYNGKYFKNYRNNENDTTSISNNIIRNIIPINNDVWIATDFGINKIDVTTKQNKRFFTSTKTANQELSYQICMDNHENLLAHIRNIGFFIYDKINNEFNALQINDNIKKMIISDSDQLIVLSDNNDLITYQINYSDQNEFKSIIKTTTQESDLINIFDSEGFSIFYYVDCLVLRKMNQEYTIPIKSASRISDLKINASGILYLSFSNGEISTYNLESQKMTVVDNLQSTIFSIYVDNQQPIIWVGTDGQGLIQIVEETNGFQMVRTKNPVRCFIPFDEKTMLVGTKGGGILSFDKKSKKLQTDLPIYSLIDKSVYTMVKNKTGDIFVGSEGEGIDIIIPKVGVKKLKYAPNISSNIQKVYKLLFSNNDSILWVGTSGFGLKKLSISKINNDYVATDIISFDSQNSNSDLSNDVIYALAQHDNEIWVGSRGGGVFVYNLKTEQFTNPDIAKCINSDILTIHNNSPYLNIGSTSGLQILDYKQNKIVQEYSISDGLLNNTVHSILGNDSILWISTNIGLAKINHTNKVVNNFTIKNGLQNNEFSDGAAYNDQEDSIYYFGGVDGFNYFNPNSIKKREFKPTIELSEIKIYNEPINIDKRIKNNLLTINHKESFVSFVFNANDYIDNENCEYAYRVPQLSSEWIQNGTNSTVVLSNLIAGSYTLEVKATNGDRVWSDNIYHLELKVLPPIWLSNIAFVIYTILFLLLAYTIYKVIDNRIKLNRKLFLEHIEKKHQEQIHENRINFFTDIAHEFFTPLSLIYGPAQYLLDKNVGKETKKYINIIKLNADRMQKLISELMEFRKIESKFTPLEPDLLDIKDLSLTIFDNYIELAKENNIEFIYKFENAGSFISSKNYLERILYNLLSNAFKYTPIFGYIEIVISQNENLFVKIKNSGAGLTESQMTNIFSKFEIFDNSNSPNALSTGLGMPITKGMVELLGGNIKVSSEINKYVCFDISIQPLEMDCEEIEQQENKTNSNLEINLIKNKKILIVEDEADVRMLLSDMLSDYYSLIQVSNPPEALDVLKHTIPDLIITDIVMPQMDGYTFLSLLNDDDLYKFIPTITISAKISNEDHLKLLDLGVEAFIDKPFHPKEVFAIINNFFMRQNKIKTYYNSEISNYTLSAGNTLHNEDNLFLLQLVELIDKNIDDEKLNIRMLAELMNTSKSTLTRKIRQLKNCSPSEMINEIRLNTAAKQLIISKKSVQTIMLKTGFSNKSYFYREFNKMFDQTPLEYRKKNQKNVNFNLTEDNKIEDL